MKPSGVHGHCLCQAIRFSIDGPTCGSAHCHCSYCRLAHGAAFVTWLLVKQEHFNLVKGEDSLRWYTSSKQSKRGFCSDCGSSLFFTSSLCPGEIHVARALVQGEEVERPQYHCFVEEKVEWVSIDDSLGRLEGASLELARYRDVAPYPEDERELGSERNFEK